MILRSSIISFPGLGIGEFEVDSVAIHITDTFTIAWYALIITIGIICAVAYTMWRARQVGITNEIILDFAIWAVPSGIIGARVYYVLTSLEKYHSLSDVLNIRNGGLAIYGAILGGALAVFIVSRVKKIPFLTVADCATPGIILAQSIGRWGNFMNGEAYGYATDIFCRMGISKLNEATMEYSQVQYVHPTFLYESLWNLLGFILINIFYKHRKYDGQVFLLVFGWYGLGRMFIEGLRSDSLYGSFFGIQYRISQVLAALIFAACLSALIYFAVKKPNKELYIYKNTKTEK